MSEVQTTSGAERSSRRRSTSRPARHEEDLRDADDVRRGKNEADALQPSSGAETSAWEASKSRPAQTREHLRSRRGVRHGHEGASERDVSGVGAEARAIRTSRRAATRRQLTPGVGRR